MKGDWTAEDIPDLTGKVAVVTGANIGLGFEIAKHLARRNATTVLACRNMEKAEAAKSAMTTELGDSAQVVTMNIDTSSMASVKTFCDSFRQQYNQLDILMCNAGIMALRERCESVDGYELQFATNHLGHFRLVGELMPLLKSTPGSRVVTQSSSANWFGSFDFDDVNCRKSYQRWNQYSFTKLANVAFVSQMNRLVKKAKLTCPQAFSVHPGLVVGQLQEKSAQGDWLENFLYRISYPVAGTYATGALPALFACTDPDAQPDVFYGPNGILGGMNGNHPKATKANALAHDVESMEKLWEESEKMTNFKYEF